jgi:hypothetical protein
MNSSKNLWGQQGPPAVTPTKTHVDTEPLAFLAAVNISRDPHLATARYHAVAPTSDLAKACDRVLSQTSDPARRAALQELQFVILRARQRDLRAREVGR